MSVSIRPLHEITEKAIALLVREIGFADTVRFVNQFSSGCGDYTAKRDALFAERSLSQILEEIERARFEDEAVD